MHEHKYELHVQDFETDKYFIALRVCLCGDSKVGDLDIRLTNAEGEVMQLSANEYGQVDYADLYGDWLVTVCDEAGEELTMFDLSAGEAPEIPDDEVPDEDEGQEMPEDPSDTEQPETPDDEEEVPETPDDGEDEPETPGDGENVPETPDDGSDETPEEPQEPVDETEGNGSSGTAIIPLIVCVLLVAGGIGLVIFLKKRKHKNQN